jgi:SNF2 family DNA or RNA helicase
MSFTRITGKAGERQRALSHDGYLHIVNRENLVWLLRQVPPDFYDALIYDEASRFKSGRLRTKSHRYTELGALVARRQHLKNIVLLSGTPTPNGVIDLWGPLKLIDDGARLGMVRQAFLDRWFVHNQWSYKWTPRPGAEAEIYARIADVFFSLKSEDYIDLPDMVEIDAWVRLPPAAWKDYSRLAREKVLEMHDIEAGTAAILANKLLQLSNGYVYDSEGDAHWFHSAKLDRLEALVEEAEGQPMLVFYSYQFDLTALRKRFPQAEVFGEAEGQVRRWNDGKIPMLLLHPQSAGHGLNLQHGGRIAVWFGLPWSLEVYQQANKRLHRPGQKEKVFLYRIVAENTFDERVISTLTMKAGAQDRLLDTLKAEVAACQ